MQKRTSPLKFVDLAEKSGLNSVSNLSTKARLAALGAPAAAAPAAGLVREACFLFHSRPPLA